jgi:hypothetical protein
MSSQPIRNIENTTGLNVETAKESQVRKRSVGAVEMQDEFGRRKTVQLDELTEADRALAEKFGYKPVSYRSACGTVQ